jgi:hypothetical protein
MQMMQLETTVKSAFLGPSAAAVISSRDTRGNEDMYESVFAVGLVMRRVSAVSANVRPANRLASTRVSAGVSVAEFDRFIANETEKWGKVVRLAGLKAE